MQDLPMPSEQPYLPSSAALTPEPQLDSWEEHQHLMNPMFLQVWRVGPRIIQCWINFISPSRRMS